MPPNRAFENRLGGASVKRAAEREQIGRRVSLVTAVADVQRTRRKRARFKRLVAIVPVSDYRDVVG
jgi:hypothetical protein